MNDHIFEHLRTTVSKLKNPDKFCVLMFDEISLQPALQYSKQLDFVEGFVDLGGGFRKNRFADHAVVFMIKGIRSGWKQPVFFFDFVKVQLLLIGLKVVAPIGDQGSTNRAAINTLLSDTRAECLRSGGGGRCRYFGYEQFYYLHFTQHGKEKVASWSHILQLYRIDQQQGLYRQCYKLTDEHVLPHKIRKMKVKIATQVFSHTVVGAMRSRTCYSPFVPKDSLYFFFFIILDPSANDTADLLLFFDMLFDSFNGSQVKSSIGKRLRCMVKHNSDHFQF
ncbi:uncharacterized protein LOC108735562 [Agrilus planipennis]|uniref:Uncharacterized protein LOC108735562 n=1 Tax=Agrilus planipennis TaxID=224129 RepID=A0A7F5R5Y9_AGRPL|nr:uncharacterized protein LOC108735562 [Agrilus planipennis]